MPVLAPQQHSQEIKTIRAFYPKLPDDVAEFMVGEHGGWYKFTQRIVNKGLIPQSTCTKQLHSLGVEGNIVLSQRLAIIIAQHMEKPIWQVFSPDRFAYSDKMKASLLPWTVESIVKEFPKLPDEVVELLATKFKNSEAFLEHLASDGNLPPPQNTIQLNAIGKRGLMTTGWRLAVYLAKSLDKPTEKVFPRDAFDYKKAAHTTTGRKSGGDEEAMPAGKNGDVDLNILVDWCAGNWALLHALLPRSLGARVSADDLQRTINGGLHAVKFGPASNAFTSELAAVHALINTRRKESTRLSPEDARVALANYRAKLKASETMPNESLADLTQRPSLQVNKL